jgi:hypothetical protein
VAAEAHGQNAVILRAAGAASGAYVAGGCSVVYDGILGPWLLPEFRDAAGVPRLHYAMILPPLRDCLARVTTRRDHGFSDLAATEHMHGDFSDATVDERHVLRTAGGGPAEVARLVLDRYESGDLLLGR